MSQNIIGWMGVYIVFKNVLQLDIFNSGDPEPGSPPISQSEFIQKDNTSWGSTGLENTIKLFKGRLVIK